MHTAAGEAQMLADTAPSSGAAPREAGCDSRGRRWGGALSLSLYGLISTAKPAGDTCRIKYPVCADCFFTGDSWCENFEQREEISPKKEHVHGVEDEKVDFRAGETSDDFPRQEILQREENMSKRRGNSWNLPS